MSDPEFDRIVLRVMLTMPHRWDRFSYAQLWRLTFSDDMKVAYASRFIVLAIHALLIGGFVLGLLLVKP